MELLGRRGVERIAALRRPGRARDGGRGARVAGLHHGVGARRRRRTRVRRLSCAPRGHPAHRRGHRHPERLDARRHRRRSRAPRHHHRPSTTVPARARHQPLDAGRRPAARPLLPPVGHDARLPRRASKPRPCRCHSTSECRALGRKMLEHRARPHTRRAPVPREPRPHEVRAEARQRAAPVAGAAGGAGARPRRASSAVSTSRSTCSS